MKQKVPSSLRTTMLLTMLVCCCLVFFRCGLLPDRYALERPKVADLSLTWTADNAHEGKLVFVCDSPSARTLEDKEFSFTCSGLNLKRRVLYYQWTASADDGMSEVHLSGKADRYERRWVPAPAENAEAESAGYRNAVALPQIGRFEAQAQPLLLNGLRVDEALIADQWEPDIAPLEHYPIPAALADRSSVVGGNTLYVRMNPAGSPDRPEVGDMMIQWLVQPMPPFLSVIGQQKNGTLVRADKPVGYQPELFTMQPDHQSYGGICAELDKRGEAKERALPGFCAFLIFVLVYLLRSDIAGWWHKVCRRRGEVKQPGCLFSIGMAVVVMVVSYEFGRLFVAPDDAWIYLAVPAAVAAYGIYYQRRRAAQEAEQPTAATPPPLAVETATEEEPTAEAAAVPPPLPSSSPRPPREVPEAPLPVDFPARPPYKEKAAEPYTFRGCAVKACGLFLLLGGLALCYSGEGHRSQADDSMAHVKEHLHTLAPDQAAPAEAEGQPVCVTGTVTSNQTLHDAAFGVAVQAVTLQRNAYVMQWEEQLDRTVVHRRRRHNRDDDDTDYKYSYSYHLRWVRDYIPTTSFHEPAGHENVHPYLPEMKGLALRADKVLLGAFTLSDAVVAEFADEELLPLPADWQPLPALLPYTPLRTENGMAEIRREPAVSSNGDRLFSWTYVPNGRTYTMVGCLKEGTIVPWQQENQAPLLLVKEGQFTADELLEEAEEDRRNMVLGMRFCYLLMVGGGLWLLGVFKHFLKRKDLSAER